MPKPTPALDDLVCQARSRLATAIEPPTKTIAMRAVPRASLEKPHLPASVWPNHRCQTAPEMTANSIETDRVTSDRRIVRYRHHKAAAPGWCLDRTKHPALAPTGEAARGEPLARERQAVSAHPWDLRLRGGSSGRPEGTFGACNVPSLTDATPVRASRSSGPADAGERVRGKGVISRWPPRRALRWCGDGGRSR